MSVHSGMSGVVSWSTITPAVSFKSASTSVFTSSKRSAAASVKVVKRPECVSAKHTGMRFQSWREPKPLRSRSGSANVACGREVTTKNREIPRTPHKSADADKCKSRVSSCKSRDSSETETQSLEASVTRLCLPTKSSQTRTSRSREAGTDMNWYSWSKMNVYKDYQAVLYGENGGLKKSARNKER